ncbi:hypothetical protein M422DRAFT_239589 [Sphaerobolus stellatus SS14]|nr:hypothetical protein M422DRAFT_239589 [Sphaerobolus stellatus SS14]
MQLLCMKPRWEEVRPAAKRMNSAPLLSPKELFKPPTFRRLSRSVPISASHHATLLMHTASFLKNQTSLSQIVPYPSLPYELCRLIFELAALEDTRTALALSLVSKDVHAWITPILYRDVSPKSDSGMAKFIASVNAKSDAASSHLLRHVQSLELIFAQPPDPHARAKLRTLSRCTNLQRLLINEGFFRSNGHKHEISSIQSWPRPWEVILLSQPSPPILDSSKFPMLDSVSHLYLGFDNLVRSLTLLSDPKNLPNLTHIGFNYWSHLDPLPQQQELHSILSKVMGREKLKMLLICPIGAPQTAFWSRDDMEEALKQLQDGRIFVGPSRNYKEIQKIFKAGGSLWESPEIKKLE